MAIAGTLQINVLSDTAAASDGFKKIANEATGLGRILETAGGVALGGMAAKLADLPVKMLHDAATAGAELARHLNSASKELGISANNVYRLETAIKQAGGSAEALGPAFHHMSLAIGEAVDGNKEKLASFAKLHIDPFKLSGETKENAFAEIVAALQQIPNLYQRAAAQQEIFAKSAREIAPLIRRGGVDAALGASTGISDKQLEAIRQFNAVRTQGETQWQRQSAAGYGSLIEMLMRARGALRSAFGHDGNADLAGPLKAAEAQNAADEKAAAAANTLAAAKKAAAKATKELADAQKEAVANSERTREAWSNELVAIRNNYDEYEKSIRAWASSPQALRLDSDERERRIKLMRQMATQLREEKTAQTEKNRLDEEGKQLNAKYDPTAEYLKKTADLHTLHARGTIGDETYKNAMTAAAKERDEQRKKINEAANPELTEMRKKADQAVDAAASPLAQYKARVAEINAWLEKNAIHRADAATLIVDAQKKYLKDSAKDLPQAGLNAGGAGSREAYQTLLQATTPKRDHDAQQLTALNRLAGLSDSLEKYVYQIWLKKQSATNTDLQESEN